MEDEGERRKGRGAKENMRWEKIRGRSGGRRGGGFIWCAKEDIRNWERR